MWTKYYKYISILDNRLQGAILDNRLQRAILDNILQGDIYTRQ